MRLDSFGYLIREGLRSIRVNKLMTLASVGVLMACMLLMGCSVVVSSNVSAILEKIEEQNVVMVFMDDDATQGQIDSAESRLKQINNVSDVIFVPKEQAWEDQLSEFDDAQAEFFRNYDEEIPLPDSFKVIISDMELFDDTVSQIKQVSNIQNVRENSELAQKLAKIRQAVNIICIVIVVLLFAVSIFIVSNTVRITIYSRRLEISIMKSVGATDAFVRLPFIVEGVVIGLIASAASLLVIWGVYELAISQLASLVSMLGSSAVPFGSLAWILLGAFLAVGVFTGVGGSIVSMNKYLKHEGSELNAV